MWCEERWATSTGPPVTTLLTNENIIIITERIEFVGNLLGLLQPQARKLHLIDWRYKGVYTKEAFCNDFSAPVINQKQKRDHDGFKPPKVSLPVFTRSDFFGERG